MHIVYAQEEAPQTYSKSVFLVGPTPRDPETPSWRPQFIEELKRYGYDGVLFVPELRDGKRHEGYEHQVGWEKKHLEMADVIAAWVPRKSPEMPAFTTNIEFGKYITGGKVIYGRPEEAEKCRYLDWMYTDHGLGAPHIYTWSFAMGVQAKINCIGGPSERTDGERHVPLHVWNTPAFQQWYASLKAAGNRLDEAKVLWTHWTRGYRKVFAFALWVKVWVAAEGRHKENEFFLSRPDISCILPYYKPDGGDLLDTKIVFVKEYRAPVRNSEGYVYELPGGSSHKQDEDPLKVAADELKEETGLEIATERFVPSDARQLASTFSSHRATLFTVRLNDEEIRRAEEVAAAGSTFGVKGDSERTTLSIKTLREALLTDAVDWSMIGMALKGLA